MIPLTDDESPDANDKDRFPEGHDDEAEGEDDGAELAVAPPADLVDDEAAHHGAGQNPQQKGAGCIRETIRQFERNLKKWVTRADIYLSRILPLLLF